MKKAKFIIVSTAVILIASLYFFYEPGRTTIFPRCPFNSFTGLLCPGCGSQRAISALLHLNFARAIESNVLLVVSIPLLIYSAAISTFNTFRQKQLNQPIFYSPAFVRVVLIVVLAFGLLRNIKTYPFTLLAP